MKLFPKSFSLVQRLRAILWAMFLVPLAVGAAFFLLYSAEALQRETVRELDAALSLQQQHIEYWVREREQDIGFVASDPRVLALPVEALTGMLGAMLPGAPFDDIVYVDETGHTRADPRHKAGVDVSDREYFRAARQGKSFVSDVITSRATKAMIFVVSSPVRDAQGRFRGLVFGSVRMDTLMGFLQSLHATTPSRSFLLDAQGRLLSPAMHPDKPGERPLRSLQAGDTLFDRAVGRLPSRGIYTNHAGQRVVGTYRWVRDGRWLLVAEKPEIQIMRLHAGILGVPLLAAGLLFLLLSPAAIRLARSLEGPVRQLEEHSRRIEGGDFDVACSPEPDPHAPVEIRQLNLAYCLMVERVRDTLDALRQASLTDHLTGSANRKLLFQEGPRLIDAALRAGKRVSLLMLDLDHFKAVNDAHGHAAGDAVLTAFADLMSQKVRQSDIFARVGGEEFAILAPNAGPTAARELAERIRAGVAALPIDIGGETISVTVSIGAATLDAAPAVDAARQSAPNHLEALLGAADEALYEAKNKGRNRVESVSISPAPARADGVAAS